MKRFSLFTIAMLALLFMSCEKDDPDGGGGADELITTLIYTLTPSDGGDDVVYRFEDKDGDGGLAPVITNGTLAANTSYTGVIQTLDESKDDVEDITLEIKEEDDEHQFFFQSSVSDLSINYADLDSAGNPVGLSTTLSTGATNTGTLRIILRHEPVKTATGVSAGDITNAEGETDIEVTFDVNVQ